SAAARDRRRAAARLDAHVAIEGLAVAERHRGRRPGEKPDGRGGGSRLTPAPDGLVDRHVRGAVARLRDEQPPRASRRHFAAGLHRRSGSRAARVWSRRRTGVVTGASWTTW